MAPNLEQVSEQPPSQQEDNQNLLNTDSKFQQKMTQLRPNPEDILYLLPSYSIEHLVLQLNYHEYIGKGTFSLVYPGFLLTLQKQMIPIALKESKLTKKQHDSKYRISYYTQVYSYGLLASCPWTVKMIAAFVNKEQKLCIVLEKCLFSLKDQMETVKANHDMVLQIFHQMIQYLAFAHNLKKPLGSISSQIESLQSTIETVIHKDIKPANILIRELTKEKVKIAVSDFGISTLAESPEASFNSGHGGTLDYSSPEMQAKSSYDSRTDCWSFGMMMRSLLFNPLSFQNLPMKERQLSMRAVRNELIHGILMRSIHQHMVVVYILYHCLEFEKSKRYNSFQLKQIQQNYHHLLKSATLQTRPEKKERNKLTYKIVVIIIAFTQEKQRSTMVGRIALSQLIQTCRLILQGLLEQTPTLLNTLELKTIASILGSSVLKGWEDKIKQIGYFAFFKGKSQDFSMPHEQKKRTIQFCQRAISFSHFSEKAKHNMEELLMILQSDCV